MQILKTLIFDNSGTMRKLIKRTILEAGVDEMVEAKDGIVALEKINELNCKTDLISP